MEHGGVERVALSGPSLQATLESAVPLQLRRGVSLWIGNEPTRQAQQQYHQDLRAVTMSGHFTTQIKAFRLTASHFERGVAAYTLRGLGIYFEVRLRSSTAMTGRECD